LSKEIYEEVMWSACSELCGSSSPQSSGVDDTTPLADRAERLRYFTDKIKELEAFREGASSSRLSRELLATMTRDLVSFAKRETSDVSAVFNAVGTLCRNPVCQKQYEDVIWSAIGQLLAAPEIPTITNKRKNASSEDGESVASKELRVETEIAAPVPPANQKTPHVVSRQDDQSKKRAIKAKIDALLSSASSEMTSMAEPTPGMQYLAHEHASMAARGDYHMLENNFDLLSNVGASRQGMLSIFGEAQRILSSGGSVSEKSVELRAQFQVIRIRLNRAFDQSEFVNQMTKYCRPAETKPIRLPNFDQISPSRSNLAVQMHQKVAQGKKLSMRKTVDFLELANIESAVISDILRLACPALLS